MTKTDIALKYRFSVEYEDGTIYEQNDTDTSVKDPIRSAFYDIDQDKVATFTLTNMENGQSHGVSLEDGHFEVNGTPFFAHNLDLNLTNFRLIFFRRHLHHFNPLLNAETGHLVSFHYGWQTTDAEGKNHQVVLEFY